jgi:hypothetical protein
VFKIKLKLLVSIWARYRKQGRLKLYESEVRRP